MDMPPITDTSTANDIDLWIRNIHGPDGNRFLVMEEGPAITPIRALRDQVEERKDSKEEISKI